MKSKGLLLLIILTFLGWIGMADAQTQFKWKLQSSVPSGDPHMELLGRLASNIDKMSGGRLKIEILPGGAIVKAFEVADAVNKGVIDAGQQWTHYQTGKHPAAGLFSAPLGGSGSGLDLSGHLSWYFNGGGRSLYLEFYQKVLNMDVMPFLYAPDGPEALGWFKKPIKSVKEFTKLRFRISAGLPSEVLKEMGGLPVSLPGAELMEAAHRGIIDGLEWINPTADLKMGIHDIFKYYCIQGLHQAIDIADIVINGKKWRELPPDIQAIVEAAVTNSIFESILYFINENSKSLKILTEEKGVKLFDAPSDYAPAWISASRKIFKKFEEKEPFFKKVLDSQRNFAKVVVPYTRETAKLSTIISQAVEK